MGLHGNRPGIIMDGSTITPAQFSAFTFYNVYVGTSAATATINGTLMNLAASSDISVVVRTFSYGSGDIYLLGDKRNVSYGSQIIGGSFTGSQ